jgi:hypothetical protein
MAETIRLRVKVEEDTIIVPLPGKPARDLPQDEIFRVGHSRCRGDKDALANFLARIARSQ